jgi:hypothetical protein
VRFPALDKIMPEMGVQANATAEDAHKFFEHHPTDSLGTVVFDPKKWYNSWPFELEVQELSEIGVIANYLYALPLPPEAITVTPIQAAEATPTLGGVTEEVSETVFWMIQMRGTTGNSVNRPDTTKPASGPKAFREVAASSGMISGALDQLANTVGAIADGIGALASGDLSGGINTLAGNKQIFQRSAVSNVFNGYTEILTFHDFLYTYSHIKEKDPTKWKLTFKHYKMGFEWDCVVKDFRVMQSKERPMTYYYELTLKCWNIRQPDTGRMKPVDRFGKDGDLYVANTLTLTGVTSSVLKMARTVRKGPAAIVDSLVKVRPTI